MNNNPMQPPNLRSLKIDDLIAIMSDINEPKYKANQIFRALHHDFITHFKDITTLKKETRDTLENNFTLSNLSIDRVHKSQDGTRKYRFKTHDNHIIESVFIPHAAKRGRHSLCISSQVGCAMGCTFCATAKIKLKRNLCVSEIVQQVYEVTKDVYNNVSKKELALEDDRLIKNIVFMGMGEPLHNADNVIAAIKTLRHEQGLNLSEKRITVSTSGLVPKITELGEKTNVYLAISLNATTNDVRTAIMPVNKKYSIEKLLAAAKEFPLKVRERITFEYVMLKGINDSLDDAYRLANLLFGLRCKVNLIPFNEHPLSSFKTPPKEVIKAFHKILYDKGLNVFTRKTRGDDIDAACGMLGGDTLIDVKSAAK